MCFIGDVSCKGMKKITSSLLKSYQSCGSRNLPFLALYVRHTGHITLCSGMKSELYREADCYRSVHVCSYLEKTCP